MKVLNIVFLLVSFIPLVCKEIIELDSKIFIAGHKGLVGSAIEKELRQRGYKNIITRASGELDLRKQEDVESFFKENGLDYVFLCAGKVGGILANMKESASFIYDNIMIALNIIQSAHKYKVKKLLYLGSSCIYPRLAVQPIEESSLLKDYLETSNEYYAIAKIAGIKLCQNYNKQYKTQFICCMPTNLYGPNDNFNLETSHVLPAILVKILTAKESKLPYVTLWGTGKALREFLYVNDLAQACIFLMETYKETEIINIGSGQEISIKELAFQIKKITGYEGDIKFDETKPDGTPRKLLDVKKITNLGWKPKISLEEGILLTRNWYLQNKDFLRI